MKTKLMLSMLVFGALAAFAAPPPPVGTGPAKWGPERSERMEAREREARLMYVVAISEALDLTEADALKLSEKIKGLEERRRPVRQAMGEAMRAVKDAAEGDATALTQIDANVQKVLDGRVQMANLDKELFNTLSQGYPPLKRAKLALVLGRLNHEKKGRRGGDERGER